MDFSSVLGLVREFLVLILVFGALLAYAVVRGKRALISLILGLYVALLISLKFPYYEVVFNLVERTGKSDTIFTILIFAVFTGIAALLFERLTADEYEESAFEGLTKKAAAAVLGTVLIMAYSYHVLPITTLFDPGVTVNTLFAPEEYFFWLLVVPLMGLFLL